MKQTGKIILILLLIAAALTAAVIIKHCHSARDLTEIVKNGRLRVIAESGGMGFAIEGDSAYGFGYEIIKAFADSLGVELEISAAANPDDVFKGLKSNDFDIAVMFIPDVEEYRSDVIFSRALLTYRQMLVQQKTDSGFIKKHYQLAGDTVWIGENSLYGGRFENLLDEIADTVFFVEMPDENLENLLRMTAQGKISRTVCPEILANKFAKIYPQLDFSLPMGFSQQHVWAVNHNARRLAEKFDEFFGNFIDSTEYWEFYGKYF